MGKACLSSGTSIRLIAPRRSAAGNQIIDVRDAFDAIVRDAERACERREVRVDEITNRCNVHRIAGTGFLRINPMLALLITTTFNGKLVVHCRHDLPCSTSEIRHPEGLRRSGCPWRKARTDRRQDRVAQRRCRIREIVVAVGYREVALRKTILSSNTIASALKPPRQRGEETPRSTGTSMTPGPPSADLALPVR